jgi:hypothetical protein
MGSRKLSGGSCGAEESSMLRQHNYCLPFWDSYDHFRPRETGVFIITYQVPFRLRPEAIQQHRVFQIGGAFAVDGAWLQRMAGHPHNV